MQQAFMDHHGLQCGFCTPGFLMLAVGVLEREPDISDEDLLDVLSSNLCRCTGYQNIIKAVRAAAKEMRGTMSGPAKFIGRSVPRLEDRPLLTGRGPLRRRHQLPRPVDMRVVRSPVAHGRIKSIDATAALALPGVHAVWTAADVAHIPPIGSASPG